MAHISNGLRVLELAGHDLIFGMKWLELYSLMIYD
jgi:hypothetical protein